MQHPTEVLLGLLFLVGFLLLLRYIRSSEGFSNPETYSLNAFFTEYPVARICPLYDTVFQKLVLTYKTDAAGHPVPDDVAVERATADVTNAVPLRMKCPVSIPTDSDLDTTLTYVRGLEDDFLVRADATLTYCETALNSTRTKAKAAMDTIPAGILPVEGFLTQCGSDELAAAETDRNALPLQCVVAETMKATDQQEITSAAVEHTQWTKQKQEISRKLLGIVKRYRGQSMKERIDRAEAVKQEMDGYEKKLQT